MKRRKLIRHLNQHGCIIIREGKKHTVYFNPVNSQFSTVPRHSEIVDKLARKICRDLGITLP